MLETGTVSARTNPAYLSTLPPNFLKTLHEISSNEIVVRAGDEFVADGQQSTRVYLVRVGLGLRAKTLPDGRRQVLSVLFPGDLVGLQAMLIGQAHHNAEARSDMRLSVIEHQRLRALWQQKFDAVALSLKAMAYDEVRLMKALLSIGQYTAEEAIASVLYSIFRRGVLHGMVRRNSMPFPFRQSDIADMLGLSLVHTNKTLAKLRRAKHLDLSDGKLTVYNADDLARAYMFDLADETYGDDTER
ncbi:Crp/Fnr family transcriptional regulator [Defluviimonas sp. WL0024]|uniref:Crp/Fnr family transcriptional regulator n=1 Tax=Albidovulum salinarum TaxID=2984153 RepID=A0ABT2X9E9_9RHOB|nr:Crp/Fnr family transcriptional regulator [Defluviimonas sp. WL0024]MCU9850250.1 Crp/Fnr family transcriptional regulator [Defluviimonas sp. WL0024]